METIGKIRRRHKIKGESISTIARDLNLSRNTIKSAAGDACQFDWSHEHVILGGVSQILKLAHFRLAHSRQMFLAAYPRESQEMVFDAHNRAFAFFGGVPARMIYDNPKTIVESILTGRIASSTAASPRSPAITCSSRWPAPRLPDGRRARSRTRSATCANGCSPRPCVLTA